MARSKKEQINIKLETAKRALEAAIQGLEEELAHHKEDKIRETPELFKKSLRLRSHRIALEGIMKLYDSSKKKQGTRLILAVCLGMNPAQENGMCDYKIRASMSTFLRGVPNCPDPNCKNKGKPLEVQMQEDDIDAALVQTLGEEILSDLERAEKRKIEAHEKFGNGKPRTETKIMIVSCPGTDSGEHVFEFDSFLKRDACKFCGADKPEKK